MKFSAVAEVVLALGWDERMVDSIAVLPAIIFTVHPKEHGATPENVIASRTRAQRVMLHEMVKTASREKRRHQLARAGGTTI